MPLPGSLAEGAAAVDVAAALCGLALDAGADGVVPGAALQGEAGAARVVANLGLAWVGGAPESLDALRDPAAFRGRLAALGVPLAEEGTGCVEIVVFGDGTTARACADATVAAHLPNGKEAPVSRGAGPWAPQRPGSEGSTARRDGSDSRIATADAPGPGTAVSPAELAPPARRAAWDLAARVVAAERLVGPVVVALATAGDLVRVAGIRPGLPSWHALVALGNDRDVSLVVAAVRVAAGDDLAPPSAATSHGIEVLVRATADGTLDALRLPDDVDATLGHAEGETICAGTLLLALRAEGPTPGDARVRAHEALGGVTLDGVASDLTAACAGVLLPVAAASTHA